MSESSTVPSGPQLRVTSRRAIAAILAILAVGVGAFLLAPRQDPQGLVRTVLLKVGQRDATATEAFRFHEQLTDLAVGMGVAGLPASVTVTIDDIVTSEGQAQTVTASWTLSVERDGALVDSREQAARFEVFDTDKGQLLSLHEVRGSLEIPIGRLLPQPVRSEAAAGAIVDDFQRGNAWLPEVSVTLEERKESLSAPALINHDADRLETYEQITDPGLAGERTIWTLQRIAPGSIEGAIDVGSAETRSPRPQQIVRGSLTQATIRQELQAFVRQSDSVLGNADPAAARMLLTPETADVVQDSGWRRMATKRPTGGEVETSLVTEGAGGVLETVLGDYTLVRTGGIGWRIDAVRSQFIVASAPGSGEPGRYTNRGGHCNGDAVEVDLKAVDFIGRSLQAYAVFQYTSTGYAKDIGCDLESAYSDDGVLEMSYQGANDGSPRVYSVPVPEVYTRANETVEAVLRLDGVSYDSLPLVVTITKFGQRDKADDPPFVYNYLEDVGDGWQFTAAEQ